MKKLKKSKALKETLKNVKGKKIPNTVNYYAYENGVVLNKDTGFATVGNITGTGKYPKVSLFIEGKMKTIETHILMGKTYFKSNWKINKNKEMNHLDGVKTNNDRSNLEITTHKKNMKHAVEVLGVRLGRLTNDEVYDIRKAYPKYKNPTVGIKNLAKKSNVSINAILNVINNITYKNL